MSVLTKLLSPGVTDDPVFGFIRIFETPADNSHCVVGFLAAFIVEDTLTIILEVRTINDGRDRAIIKSIFLISFVIKILDLNRNFAGTELALALCLSVRIINEFHQSTDILNVVECSIDKASSATVVGIRAVNQLLL
jgi:hypothetical protein